MTEVRATLDPKKIYLNTCSIFHQMFTDEHLNDVRKVDKLIHGHCSAGVSHSVEKGLCSSIFDMWLVRNIISNLILLP